MHVVNSELTIRDNLLSEVRHFVERARVCPGVRRIALIGSLATNKENPKDADMLITVDDDADLAMLATAGRKLKGRAQSRNKGADIFWLIRQATTSAVSATGVSATLGSVPHAMRAIAGGALTCTTILMTSCSTLL